jgi:hypothetical protein
MELRRKKKTAMYNWRVFRDTPVASAWCETNKTKQMNETNQEMKAHKNKSEGKATTASLANRVEDTFTGSRLLRLDLVHQNCECKCTEQATKRLLTI